MRLSTTWALAPAGCVIALAALAGCTPLLGGPVPCNDNSDCPPSRPSCEQALCEPSGLLGEGEGEGSGEGEGEGEPDFAVINERVEPFRVQPGVEVVFSFAAAAAERCVLELDRVPRPIRALSAAEIAAGEVRFSFTLAEIEAATDDDSLVMARLTCTRGTDEDAVVVAVQVDPTFPVTLNVSERQLPLSGGSVEACWDAPETAQCTLFHNGVPQVEQGEPAGCAEIVLGASEAPVTRSLHVHCTDTEGHVGGAEVFVLQGQGIARFEADRTILAAPGEVELVWQSAGLACVLSRIDAAETDPTLRTPLSQQPSGTLRVPIERSTVFVLACEDAGGLVAGPTIAVGVGPEVLGFEMASANRGQLGLAYRARLATACSVVLSSGERSGGDPLAPTVEGGRLLTFASDPEVGSTDVSVRCSGFAGTATADVTLVDATPPRIVNDTLVLDGTREIGRTIGYCWDSENAAHCYVYNDDDAVEVPLAGCREVTIDEGLYRTLTCTDEAHVAADVVYLELGPGPTAFLTAEPHTLAQPGTVRLRWTSQGATSCEVRGAAGAVVATGILGEEVVEVTETTEFAVACEGEEGATGSQPRTVIVGPAITDLRAEPSLRLLPGEVQVPEGIDLTWDSENVVRCAVRAVNGHGRVELDNLAPRSAAYVSHMPGRQRNQRALLLPLALPGGGDTTIDFSCDDGEGGLQERQVILEEPGVAVITQLQAVPAALPLGGGTADVCWSSTGARFCGYSVEIGGVYAGGEQVPTSGCLSDLEQELQLTDTARFVFGCNGYLGLDNEVLVIPVGPYVHRFTASPAELETPGTAVLSWDVANVSTCEVRDADGDLVAAGGAAAARSVAVAQTTSFALACDGGDATAELYVVVGPSILELALESQGHSMVQWTLRAAMVDACSLRLEGEGGRVIPVDSSQLFDGCREGCTEATGWDWLHFGAPTLQASCTSDLGPVYGAATALPPPLPPAVTLTASPAGLPAGGGMTTLCWSAADATECYLGGLAVDAAGGCEERVVAQTESVGVVCLNETGSEATEVRIGVGPAILDLRFDKLQVLSLSDPTVTFHWETQGMQSCRLTAGPLGTVQVATSGSLEVTWPTGATGTDYFNLQCDDGDPATLPGLFDDERYATLQLYAL